MGEPFHARVADYSAAAGRCRVKAAGYSAVTAVDSCRAPEADYSAGREAGWPRALVAGSLPAQAADSPDALALRCRDVHLGSAPYCHAPVDAGRCCSPAHCFLDHCFLDRCWVVPRALLDGSHWLAARCSAGLRDRSPLLAAHCCEPAAESHLAGAVHCVPQADPVLPDDSHSRVAGSVLQDHSDDQHC